MRLVLLVTLLFSIGQACGVLRTVETIANLTATAVGQLDAYPERDPSVISPTLDVSWSADAPLVSVSEGETKMVAAEGVVLLAETVYPGSRYLAFRADGEEHESRLGLPIITGAVYRLASSDELIYFGTRFGAVVAVDPRTLEVRWRKHLQFPAAIFSLSFADGLVFAETSHVSVFALEASTGEIVGQDFPLYTYAWSSESDVIIEGSISARRLANGTELWVTPIPGGVQAPPLFTESRIAVRGGRNSGDVYLLDRSSGTVLSRSSRPVVSNIAVGRTSVYGLSQDATLRSWNLENGTEEELVRFGSTQIDIDTNQAGGYFVAVDNFSRTIFVYLGDVRKLYAFNLDSHH